MREPIRTKAESYRLLSAGLLGNATRQFFDVGEWKESPDYALYDLWGVRTLTPGGPCRLNCPRGEVEQTVRGFAPHSCNVSVMVGPAFGVSLMAEVWIGDAGLSVYGIENQPDDADWRRDMPKLGRQFGRLESSLILRRRLNANSLADLESLLELYPGHVVELSVLKRCYGCVPGRNAVVWEVRIADGSYERPTWRNPAWEPFAKGRKVEGD